MKNKTFSKFTYVGYGMTDLFGSGAFSVVAAWYMIFLTTYAGLSATEAALIFAITRSIDAVVNPLMGVFTDKFGKTKLGKLFGRRRFFLLLGIPLIPVYAMLWVSDQPFMYYLLMFIATETLATMVLVPWETLPTEMTNDFNKRSYLSNWRFIWAGLAYTLANFIPGQMFRYFGEDNPDVFFYNAIAFCILFATAFLVTYLTTWERTDIEHDDNADDSIDAEGKKKKLSIIAVKNIFIETLSTMKIRIFRQHLVIYICSFTALDLFGGVFVFWVVYALHLDKVVVADSMSLGGAIAMPLGFLSAWFLIKLGTKRLFGICYFVVILALSVITSLNYFNIDPAIMRDVLFVTIVLFVVFKGPLYYLPWNLYSFIPDIDELVTKQRREGTFAGVMTLVRKFSQAITMVILGVLLDLGGLVKNSDTQPASLTIVMQIILIAGVIFFVIVAAYYALFKYNLNKENHLVVLAEIERLKAGGKPGDVSDEHRAITEDLTGYKAEQFWGNNHVLSSTPTDVDPKTPSKTYAA